MVGLRLFLPESWTDDPERRRGWPGGDVGDTDSAPCSWLYMLAFERSPGYLEGSVSGTDQRSLADKLNHLFDTVRGPGSEGLQQPSGGRRHQPALGRARRAVDRPQARRRALRSGGRGKAVIRGDRGGLATFFGVEGGLLQRRGGRPAHRRPAGVGSSAARQRGAGHRLAACGLSAEGLSTITAIIDEVRNLKGFLPEPPIDQVEHVSLQPKAHHVYQGETSGRYVMPKVSASIQTAVDPDQAWQLAVDLSRQPEWLTMHDAFTGDVPGTLEAGVAYKQRVKMMGMPTDDRLESPDRRRTVQARGRRRRPEGHQVGQPLLHRAVRFGSRSLSRWSSMGRRWPGPWPPWPRRRPGRPPRRPWPSSPPCSG